MSDWYSFQAAQKQVEREKQVLGLVKFIEDTIDFLIASRELQDNKMSQGQKEICRAMLQQSAECGYFIRDYASHGFCKYLSFMMSFSNLSVI
jgi:hypothetical protein